MNIRSLFSRYTRKFNALHSDFTNKLYYKTHYLGKIFQISRKHKKTKRDRRYDAIWLFSLFLAQHPRDTDWCRCSSFPAKRRHFNWIAIVHWGGRFYIWQLMHYYFQSFHFCGEYYDHSRRWFHNHDRALKRKGRIKRWIINVLLRFVIATIKSSHIHKLYRLYIYIYVYVGKKMTEPCMIRLRSHCTA